MLETAAEAVTQPRDNALSVVLIGLLKGVVYLENDAVLWASLLDLRASVRDYVAVLGLSLVLDEAEGYAFLRAHAGSEDETSHALPRLVARRPLSFPVSLLLVLLRKKMLEFDALGGDTRLVLSRDEIVELIRVFLPVGSHDTRLIDQVESHLKRVIELGFVRVLKGDTPMYEVRRILKAFIDAQWLTEFAEKLAAYREHVQLDVGDNTDE
ncbi:DUF4194 domain-containing protein [Deefgea sp. CFH1-16]|uniref:DUF4194 domain-containing protein n=1 Tax=Deefgea sp. CFH1-16 TaxID=2675457 RepID=UPI0015F6B30A|nr:DUF4194 domain-containing protein [Deefgea sp. CFH1-16]MBM5573768.1 DUF4194 domain-containing protein [Deefgea sp. CFH1-16]